MIVIKWWCTWEISALMAPLLAFLHWTLTKWKQIPRQQRKCDLDFAWQQRHMAFRVVSHYPLVHMHWSGLTFEVWPWTSSDSSRGSRPFLPIPWHPNNSSRPPSASIPLMDFRIDGNFLPVPYLQYWLWIGGQIQEIFLALLLRNKFCYPNNKEKQNVNTRNT